MHPNHAKQLRADGASGGASRGIANVNLHVRGGEMKLGRLDSNRWFTPISRRRRVEELRH